MAKAKKNKRSSRISGKSWLACAVFLCVILWQAYQSAVDAESHSDNYSLSQTDPLLNVTVPDSLPSEILNYPGFTVSFNAKCHQPNWVAWELTRAEAQSAEISRSNSAFSPDFSVSGCATLADYKGSGYDRGHMCPAGDMKWSQESMDACFLLTNMCPQANSLNNGAWKNLEEKCRTWAIRDSAIVIICGPVLSDRLVSSIGESRVPVPERFFKVVLAPYASPMRGIAFVMPNSKVRGGVQAAAVSIDQVEQITGFDFFSCLPADVQDRVESECNFPKWEKKQK